MHTVSQQCVYRIAQVGVLVRTGCIGAHFFELLLSKLRIPIYRGPVHAGDRIHQHRAIAPRGRGDIKVAFSGSVGSGVSSNLSLVANYHEFDYHSYFLRRPHRPGEGGANFLEVSSTESR